MTKFTSNPFAIHVGASPDTALQLEQDARTAGASVVQLSLAGVQDRRQLCDRLSQTFMYPHESSGLDAAIDLISDLEWLGSSRGYLLVVDADKAPSAVTTDLARILPAIIDRWRSQTQPFVVAITMADVSDVSRALERANAALDDAASLPWAQPGTGSVLIVNHADTNPAS